MTSLFHVTLFATRTTLVWMVSIVWNVLDDWITVLKIYIRDPTRKPNYNKILRAITGGNVWVSIIQGPSWSVRYRIIFHSSIVHYQNR